MVTKPDPAIGVNAEQAAKVLKIVDKGLVNGMGVPEPGKMCVEAAVAYAYGEPHSDHPTCVHSSLASIKIGLNDEHGWNSPKARAKGLRRLAIAQLGSVKKFSSKRFVQCIRNMLLPKLRAQVEAEVKQTITDSLNYYRKLQNKSKGKVYAMRDNVRVLEVTLSDKLSNLSDNECPGSYFDDGGELADVLKFLDKDLSAAVKRKRDRNYYLTQAAEVMVQALIKMKMPGTKYLYLTKSKKRKTSKTTKRRKHK